MKTLYIECNMGAAGDMLMAGLLELHPDPDGFIERLNQLGIPGVEIRREKSTKQGIVGTNIRVLVKGEEESSRDYHPDHHEHHHDHDHPHDHTHDHDHYHHHDHDHHEHSHDHSDHHHGELSTLPNVTKIISELSIPEGVKQNALAIYQLIAEAEAKAHDRDVAQVHFHEVGALDAVTDIVGNCLLLDELKPDQIVVSPVHVGSGMVKCAHGTLPVPAPATAHILRGVPTYSGDIRGELCTPTGAAILKHFADRFGPQPVLRVEKIGYGMGKKDFTAANMVRIFLGDTDDRSDEIIELSCNLDDMTGEAIGHAFDVLMQAGALDVHLSQIQMKKNRPGVMLHCMCRPEQSDRFAQLLLKHTTTFGVRKTAYQRYVLTRTEEQFDSSLGLVRIKSGIGHGADKSKYEYDDLVRIADQYDLSLDQLIKILNNERMR